MANTKRSVSLPTEELKAALEELLVKCLISFSHLEVHEEPGDIIRINIAAEEPALVIGKHAENLFALQQMYRLIARKKLGLDVHLILDVDNYRRNQEESAAVLAREAARRVKESGMPQELMPMPSYKRRAIHTFFTMPDFQEFKVYSVGEGEERRVRVELK